MASAKSRKRKKQCVNDHSENRNTPVVTHTCGWWLCTDAFQDFDELKTHVMSHIEPYQNTGAVSCMWKGCDLPSEKLMSYDEASRHLSFHVHHCRLKFTGDCFLKTKTSSKCRLPSSKANSIPYGHSDPFICLWSGCAFESNNISEFYRHVNSHASCQVTDHCLCLWSGCAFKGKTRTLLKEHLHKHTLEKVAACSVCGGFFANKEKLLLHVERQMPVSGAETCSFCHKSFPTKSLLLQHVYHHVNHYQCPYCGFTVRAPSDLQRHVFNKHQMEKPFYCEQDDCGACFKHDCDLKRHISDVHKKETKFECFVENCEFSCIHFAKLVTHLKQDHKDLDHPQPQYACHLCEAVFSSGPPLSRHAKTIHKMEYPHGTGRFRFVLDSDGLYRIQVERVNQLKESTRDESVENISNNDSSNANDNDGGGSLLQGDFAAIEQAFPFIYNTNSNVTQTAAAQDGFVVFMQAANLSNDVFVQQPVETETVLHFTAL